MKIQSHRRTGVVLGLLSIAMASANSGCTPLEAGEVERFARDLFLSALAAYLF